MRRPARLARRGLAQPRSPAPPLAAQAPPVRRRRCAPTRVGTPIRIDGKLDEAIYAQTAADHRLRAAGARRVRSRPPRRPRRGSSSTTTTSTCRRAAGRSHPERRVANEMRRDTSQLRQNDTFAVLFDTFHDRRNGYIFYANAIGGLADSQVTDEGPPNVDWNTVWDVRTGDFDGGWTIEMAIPFKSLRYQPGPRSDVGHQPAPRRALEERVVVPRAGAARADDVSRHPQDLVGRHARGPAGAVGQPQPRAEAVRARRASRPTTR